MYPPGKSLDCIYVYMSNDIEANVKRKSWPERETKKKIYICDLILLPGSSYNYLQPEDLQAPTGDKNTENTSEKRHSNYLLEEHPGCQDCVIQKVIHAMIPSKQSSTLTY